MKKIFLSVLIALSFQTIAQTSSLDMSKILEPSKEEQEKRYYKELNAQINPPLIHDEKAPLVTEEECFEEAYDELKKYVERVENETNTKYRGYENQIKQLTEFTNKKARGMGCKKATLFYKRELYDRLRDFVKREAENQERIENSIAQSKAADLKVATEYQKMEEEKEFNSNPKNFPYKETWFDYDKGIYEIKTYPIKNKKEIIEIANKNKVEFTKLLCPMEKMNKTFDKMHISEFDIETIYGLAVNIDKVKYIKINLPFLEDFTLKVKKFSYSKYHNSLEIFFEEDSEYIKKINNETFEYSGVGVRDENMAARWNKAANLKNSGSFTFTYVQNEIIIHIAPIVQKLWKFEDYVRENNPEYIDYLIKSHYFNSGVPAQFLFRSIDNMIVLSYCHADNYITWGD